MNNAVARQWIQAPVDLIAEQLERLRDESDADTALRIRDNVIVPAIEKLAALACSLVPDAESEQAFAVATNSLYDVYQMPHDLGLDDNRHHEIVSFLWHQIITRVYIVGAFAIREKRFSLVRPLVAKRPSWDEYWAKVYWTRHALTMLSRRRALKTKSLCGEALIVLDESNYFMNLFGRGASAKERATDFICQFDLLQNVISVADNNDIDAAYPSFAYFYGKRVMPLVLDLVTSGPSRTPLGDLSDQSLADILLALDRYAGREAFAGGPWDAGEWTTEIREFLNAHKTQPQPA